MDWLMDPFKGFKEVSLIEEEQCTVQWCQCTCTAGLLICTKPGALVMDQPTG